MTIFELLKNIKAQLVAGGIESADAEAEIILAELFKTTRPNLFILAGETVTQTLLSQVEAIVSRRVAGEPLQYIQGKAYFMNICLEVGPGVLIPRPETEMLVELICRDAPAKAMICDVGTGSGAIALAIAFERPDVQLVGLDISNAALAIAERNRRNCKLDNVTFIRSDLFTALSGVKFDFIAANLPYIGREEYEKLAAEVKEHEPARALFAEDNGLAIIKRAALQMPAWMHDSARAIFEIGATQGVALQAFLMTTNCFSNVEIIQDLNQLDRFVCCTKL